MGKMNLFALFGLVANAKASFVPDHLVHSIDSWNPINISTTVPYHAVW